MGTLDGALAQSIFNGFKGKLLKGTIYQQTIDVSGSLDSRGDPLDSAMVGTAMEGFVDDYSDFSHAQAGIPESDRKVCIFGKSCPGVTPGTDDIVKFTQAGVVTWYQLRKAKVDPALALWECQGFVIPEPAL